MSNTDQHDQPAEEPTIDQDQVDGASDATEDQDADPRLSKLRGEAAKYRTRAKEAEERADKALALMDAVATSTVSAILRQHHIEPGSILDAGHDPLDFIEEGSVNIEKLIDAVLAQEKKLGCRLGKNYRMGRPIAGNFAEDPNIGMQGADPKEQDWSDALRR